MGKSSTSWKLGQSGNPGGRPKEVAEVRELARQHTEAAMNRLVAIVESDKSTDAAAVSAAREILDRGYGKSEQYIEQKNTGTRDQTPSEVFAKDIDAALSHLGPTPDSETQGERTH